MDITKILTAKIKKELVITKPLKKTAKGVALLKHTGASNGKSNLTVLTDTNVAKINIVDETASGVQCIDQGKNIQSMHPKK